MKNETALSTANENKVTIFGRAREALEEASIDLAAIVETYEYFISQRAEDPELKISTYRVRIPSGGGRSLT